MANIMISGPQFIFLGRSGKGTRAMMRAWTAASPLGIWDAYGTLICKEKWAFFHFWRQSSSTLFITIQLGSTVGLFNVFDVFWQACLQM